jgi:hypothetical protein
MGIFLEAINFVDIFCWNLLLEIFTYLLFISPILNKLNEIPKEPMVIILLDHCEEDFLQSYVEAWRRGKFTVR